MARVRERESVVVVVRGDEAGVRAEEPIGKGQRVGLREGERGRRRGNSDSPPVSCRTRRKEREGGKESARAQPQRGQRGDSLL